MGPERPEPQPIAAVDKPAVDSPEITPTSAAAPQSSASQLPGRARPSRHRILAYRGAAGHLPASRPSNAACRRYVRLRSDRPRTMTATAPQCRGKIILSNWWRGSSRIYTRGMWHPPDEPPIFATCQPQDSFSALALEKVLFQSLWPLAYSPALISRQNVSQPGGERKCRTHVRKPFTVLPIVCQPRGYSARVLAQASRARRRGLYREVLTTRPHSRRPKAWSP